METRDAMGNERDYGGVLGLGFGTEWKKQKHQPIMVMSQKRRELRQKKLYDFCTEKKAQWKKLTWILQVEEWDLLKLGC